MAQRVVVGLSGGVDSSVAALLLKRQGYEVIGVFMKNWEEKDEEGACTSDADFADVRRVCEVIDIPYYTVDFAREYWDRVFTHFLEEYKRGRTPNPDILCNREIKFKAFLEFALSIGADKIATGHFVRSDAPQGKPRLLRGVDPGKDQSYFLYEVPSAALGRALFPVGGMTKAQVRALAAQEGLVTAGKRDSTGICFIGERNFRQFLAQYLPAQPGQTLDFHTGRVVGQHMGLMYYTLGQRRGLGIGGDAQGDGRRWFVIRKDLENNILYVAQGEDAAELYSGGLIAHGLHFFDPDEARESFACTAKFRYRQGDQGVRVTRTGPDEIRVEFETRQRAVTPGQSVVLYDGEVCLGGGVIDQVLD